MRTGYFAMPLHPNCTALQSETLTGRSCRDHLCERTWDYMPSWASIFPMQRRSDHQFDALPSPRLIHRQADQPGPQAQPTCRISFLRLCDPRGDVRPMLAEGRFNLGASTRVRDLDAEAPWYS